MRPFLRLVVPALAFVPALWASQARADQPGPEKDRSPSEQYEALVREYQAAQEAYFKAFEDARTALEKGVAAARKAPSPNVYAGRFLELAKQHPDDGAAIDALIWVVANAPRTPQSVEALDVIARDHLESPKLVELCPHLLDRKPMETLLRALIEKNPHQDVQGEATYRLAELLQERPGRATGILSGYARLFGKARDSGDAADEAERLFDRVIARYGDVRSSRGTLGDRARSQLFEIRNLAIGKTAPEIEGEDVDGRRLKLSDYRGKVVVLDFWGDW